MISLLLSLFLLLAPKPEIALKVDPKVAFAGRPVLVTTTVKPHPDIRVAKIEFDFGGSTWEIAGDQGDRIDRRQFVFRIPEAGEFELRFLVYDSQGRILATKVETVTRAATEP
jgi:hypothetical protein